MTYSIKMIKKDSYLLWMAYVVSALLIWVLNPNIQFNVLLIFFAINGICFGFIYYISCFFTATWSVDEKTFSVKGVTSIFFQKQNDINISLAEISTYKTTRYPTYNKLQVRLNNKIKHSFYFDKWAKTETNYSAFIKDFEQKISNIKNTRKW